jgi:hypothetical protein
MLQVHYLYQYRISILCSNVQVAGNPVEWVVGYVAGSLPLSISNIDSLQVSGNSVEWVAGHVADSPPTSILNIDSLFYRAGTWRFSRVGGRLCCRFTTSIDIEY